MVKSITNKSTLYILIGGFSLFLFIETAYFTGLVLKDFLMFINQKPLLIFVLNELIQIISFTLLVVLGLRFISKKELVIKQLKSIPIVIIILCIVIQALQILYRGFINFEENSLENLENYISYLNKNYVLYVITSILNYFQYVIFALVLFNYKGEND